MSKQEKKHKGSKKSVSRYFNPEQETDTTEEKTTEKAQVYYISDRKVKRSILYGKDRDGEQKTFFNVAARKEEKKTNKTKDIEDGALRWQDKRFHKVDPFPGDAPVPRKAMDKFKRGPKMNTKYARTKTAQKELRKNESKMHAAAKQSARAELLLQEDAGFLELEDELEDTTKLSQHDIVKAVDITSAQKHFALTLPQFGPYHVNYTRNGRFLLMGGAKGHVAAIDWFTKKLNCEINVMETVHDVKWLHQETMFAVAQKQCVYIYDNQGIELHCLRKLDRVLRMEFLPFHFLLATSNDRGYLSWLDISVGKQVTGHRTGLGRLDVLCQNPKNAVLCLGHNTGTVSMWTPNVNAPVVKMLCHKAGVKSIAVDGQGQYLATSGIDRKLKIWDLRTYKMLQSYNIGIGASHMAFSQRGMLALSKGPVVEVYDDCCSTTAKSPYLCHRTPASAAAVQFCPYEDVLGVGHGTGFESLLIPGSGEPNFDALEANPYQSRSQRKEAEVKMLLDKIPADLINIDSKKIEQVDVEARMNKVNERNKKQFLKPEPEEYKFIPKYKMKGKNKGGKREQRKQGVKEQSRKEFIRSAMKDKQKQAKNYQHEKNRKLKSSTVLDRFKKKND